MNALKEPLHEIPSVLAALVETVEAHVLAHQLAEDRTLSKGCGSKGTTVEGCGTCDKYAIASPGSYSHWSNGACAVRLACKPAATAHRPVSARRS